MKLLDPQDFVALRAGATVLEADGHGEKVLALADGTFLKLFRRKHFLSSTAWYPYAQRFADNAGALAALGIPSPVVIQVYRLPAIRRDAVHYRPLAGQTLRQLIAADTTPADLRFRFGAFVARLHQLGVYFRSLHLGNVVLTPNGEFGLIDISDLEITRRPLGKRRIDRNMRHIYRLTDDRAWLSTDENRDFLSGYSSVSSHVPAIAIQ